MTLYDFNKLTLEEKKSTLWKLGIFLDNFVTDKERINCYAIGKFFVEVHYDRKFNAITSITAFKYGPNLDKYSKL